jgi:hypothetical protein
MMGLQKKLTPFNEWYRKWHENHETLLRTFFKLNSSIFWDITLCSLLKANKHFEEHAPPSSEMKNKPSKKPSRKQVASRLTFNRLHGIISQNSS